MSIPAHVRITRTHNVIDLQMDDEVDRLERAADAVAESMLYPAEDACRFARECPDREACPTSQGTRVRLVLVERGGRR